MPASIRACHGILCRFMLETEALVRRRLALVRQDSIALPKVRQWQ